MADERRITSTRRWRDGLALAAVVVPVGCSALFERQARRLDALADHGRATTGTITAVDAQGTTHYRYEVDGAAHSWNVARAAAPFPVGAELTVTYLPEDPSLSRPVVSRGEVAAEAAGNRRFARRVAAGEVIFFGLFAAMAHRDLGRLRADLDPMDPAVYRRRVREALAVVGALVAMVSVAHALDARSRGSRSRRSRSARRSRSRSSRGRGLRRAARSARGRGARRAGARVGRAAGRGRRAAAPRRAARRPLSRGSVLGERGRGEGVDREDLGRAGRDGRAFRLEPRDARPQHPRGLRLRARAEAVGAAPRVEREEGPRAPRVDPGPLVARGARGRSGWWGSRRTTRRDGVASSTRVASAASTSFSARACASAGSPAP
ncbi:MAG: hypothetical protein U0325_11215 [Polyangiales bacterium]